MKVYLTSPINPEAQALLAANTELEVGTEDIDRPAFMKKIQDADIVFNKLDPLTMDAEVMDVAPNLKLIARHGSGFSNIDIDAATRRGIMVTSTPGVNSTSIAEYAIGLMLASTRNLIQAAQASHLGNPDRQALMGMELAGKTLGIIGVGHIGREVTKRAHALGMKIIAYHPRPSAKNLGDLPLELVDLPTLLSQSDVISIHCPLTPQTRGLIGEKEFGLVKPGAHILNLSRGGVVQEEPLRKALAAKKLGGYATDVLEHEPVRSDEPLLSEPRALVFPHIAAMTDTVQKNVAMTAVEDILRFCRGEKPLNIVNPEVV